ncbi:MAG TPA: topoisomerase II [Candidatus Brachybacterium merdigallinarum]|nr:topoisomerase II [Candidatus Brachybacterium merdigallinarum]
MSSPSTNDLVRRPFEGLPNERDLVAMRQLIPAATMSVQTTSEHGAADVVIATILPMAWPAVRRSDGTITVGIQASYPGGDLSRGLGQAILDALAAENGTPVPTVQVTAESPRLQDILDLDGDFEITLHDTFDFWIDPGAERTAEVEHSLQHANESILPTASVPGLPHAYWVDAGAKEHLRWVLDADEDRVIDAVTRLHARRESGVGEGTKYAGSFRADGLSVPVWDLPKGTGVEGLAGEIEAFRTRFEEALAVEEPLTALERRARGGIVARQVTLR